MSYDNALQTIKTYIIEKHSLDELADDLDLIEEDLITSLDLLGLVVLIENLTQKSIPLEQVAIDNLRSINTIKSTFLS